jgi:hypothetical protein
MNFDVIRFEVTGATGEQLAKRMFKLAWDACGGPSGYGFFQDRGPAMTEDQIWERAIGNGDYPGMGRAKPGRADGDFVFGRMMKLGFLFGDSYVEGCATTTWRRDYQGFCGKYPDFASLAKAAAESLGVALVGPLQTVANII